MEIASLQERVRELLEILSRRVRQENISDRYDINRISENVLVPILRVILGVPNLRNLNYTEWTNYPGIDLADESTRLAVQVTATSNNQKVIETLTKVKSNRLDTKYRRIVILILTVKQRSYSAKNYPQLEISFSERNDIWDYNDLSRMVSEIVDLDRLIRIRDVLENSMGSGQPFAHRPMPAATEKIEANLLHLKLTDKLYTASLRLDKKKLKARLAERGKMTSRVSDRDLIDQAFVDLEAKYPKDFVVKGGELVTFHDLLDQEHPYRNIVILESIECMPWQDFVSSNSENLDSLKELLRRCLMRIVYPHGINWHAEDRRFYFTFDNTDRSVLHNENMNRFERIISWKEKRRDSRYVSFRRYPNGLPDETWYQFHLAFAVRFHLIDTWFLEITPDWVATRDGYKNSRRLGGRRYRIGYLSEKVKDKKEEEQPFAVFNNFRFIRSYLRAIAEPLLQQSFIHIGDDVAFQSSPILEDKIWNPDFSADGYERSDELDALDIELPVKKRRGRRRRPKKEDKHENVPNVPFLPLTYD